MRVFLIGGGAGSPAAHRPFVQAATGTGTSGGPVVVHLLDEPGFDRDRWDAELRAAGAERVEVVVVSPDRPPTVDDLDGASGVYVAGGWTPGYRDVLVDAGTDWLAPVRAGDLPYAGFSAGSAVAASSAVVGGWQVTVDGRVVPICHEDVGEDLVELTVAPGLGLVPFLVDVHAAQWGTLPRLVHAVLLADSAGAAATGWAIDEATALEVHDGAPVAVHGIGAVTLVRTSPVPGAVEVVPVVAGGAIPDLPGT